MNFFTLVNAYFHPASKEFGRPIGAGRKTSGKGPNRCRLKPAGNVLARIGSVAGKEPAALGSAKLL